LAGGVRVCAPVRVCLCTVLNSYCYGVGVRILSVCAGYQNATHPSCQLPTVYMLPAIHHTSAHQTDCATLEHSG